jgi:hypothetical protein
MQTLAGSVLPLGIMMLGILMIRFVEGTLWIFWPLKLPAMNPVWRY